MSATIAGAAGAAAQKPTLEFQPVANWGLIPHGITFYGDATSIAIDSKDLVYVFNRGPVPVVVLDSAGNYVAGWGAGEFGVPERDAQGPAILAGPHGISVDPEDNLLLVDVASHVVEKWTTGGRMLLRIGNRHQPSAAGSGEPFNRPTDAVMHPKTGDIFVSDGYRNYRLHRYDSDGKHITSWGTSGTRPGQFNTPHGLVVLEDDRVFVCDRENFRVQVFTTKGEFVQQWHCYRPSAIRAHGGLLYVAEGGARSYFGGLPNLGHAVSVFDFDGQFVTRFGAPDPGQRPGQFIAPHGIALDVLGNVYVAEVSASYLKGQSGPFPRGEITSLRKWSLTEAATR
jgi:sugar lactone lactonase YvrE